MPCNNKHRQPQGPDHLLGRNALFNAKISDWKVETDLKLEDKFKKITKSKRTLYYPLFNDLISEFTKLLQQRQLLDGQLNENKCVLDELNVLTPENKVGYSTSNKKAFFPSNFFVFFPICTIGVQIIWSRIGETGFGRKSPECYQTNGLHKRWAETLQWHIRNSGKETGSASGEIPKIPTTISTNSN